MYPIEIPAKGQLREVKIFVQIQIIFCMFFTALHCIFFLDFEWDFCSGHNMMSSFTRNLYILYCFANYTGVCSLCVICVFCRSILGMNPKRLVSYKFKNLYCKLCKSHSKASLST